MVCLVMLVRDEEQILRETLEAVKPLIDRYCIVDTGSVDHTPMIIEDVLSDMPGRLVRMVWTDFGHARTRAFDEARAECEGEGYALIIDADSTVIHEGRSALAAELSGDSQDVELRHGGESNWMPCVLSLAHPWRWHGPLHEYLVGEPWAVPGPAIGSVRIEPRPGGASYRDPEKYLRHADILHRAAVNDPENAPRWTFYEANSWKDAGCDVEAVEVYERRANMVDGWAQERYVSWLRAGDAHQRLSAPLGTLMDCWLAGYEIDPTRPECLLRFAAALRDLGRFRAAWLAIDKAREIVCSSEPHGLFAEVDCWGWKCWFEVAVCAWWAEEKQAGLEASARVLMDPAAPENVRERVQANLAFYA